MQKSFLPLLLKTAGPAGFGAVGAIMAIVWSDGFRAFCAAGGLQ